MSFRLEKRHFGFLLCVLLSLLLFRSTLFDLVALSISNEKYTHIMFIPAIAGILAFVERRLIFPPLQYSLQIGSGLLAIAAATGYIVTSRLLPLSPSGALSARAAVMVLVWISAFFLCYGSRSARAAVLPLCLLAAVIPVPASWMEKGSVILQQGSAEVSHRLFKIANVPVYREDMRFSLPGLTIEVAEECSGIRSSIGLLIGALIAGHLLLHSGLARFALVILAIPITIFKNAVRIVVLSVLGTYVSRDFITGDLHHSGGPLFSILSFALLALVLLVFLRLEKPLRQRLLSDRPDQSFKQQRSGSEAVE